MQLTSLLLPLLSTLSLASALSNAQPSNWTATNFQLECSPGGCAYRFNISAPASQNAPGFQTYCEGLTPNATACANNTITAAVSPLINPTWNVKVQHEWHVIEEQYNSEATYWQAGSANVTQGTKAFLIKPDVFYGVA